MAASFLRYQFLRSIGDEIGAKIDSVLGSVNCLDAAEDELLAALPGMFIYRGGHHIAIHEQNSMGAQARLCLIEEIESSSNLEVRF
jgi:hypothetical protein